MNHAYKIDEILGRQTEILGLLRVAVPFLVITFILVILCAGLGIAKLISLWSLRHKLTTCNTLIEQYITLTQRYANLLIKEERELASTLIEASTGLKETKLQTDKLAMTSEQIASAMERFKRNQ